MKHMCFDQDYADYQSAPREEILIVVLLDFVQERKCGPLLWTM